MQPRQEFLVLETDGQLAVYAPRQFPIGTPIGRNAQRLGVNGPTLIQPPRIHFTSEEFSQWRQELTEEGFAVTLGPFWRDPVSPEEIEEQIRLGKTTSLQDAFDELLREAERREQEKAQRMEAVEPRHP